MFGNRGSILRKTVVYSYRMVCFTCISISSLVRIIVCSILSSTLVCMSVFGSMEQSSAYKSVFNSTEHTLLPIRLLILMHVKRNIP